MIIAKSNWTFNAFGKIVETGQEIELTKEQVEELNSINASLITVIKEYDEENEQVEADEQVEEDKPVEEGKKKPSKKGK